MHFRFHEKDDVATKIYEKMKGGNTLTKDDIKNFDSLPCANMKKFLRLLKAGKSFVKELPKIMEDRSWFQERTLAEEADMLQQFEILL